MIKVAIANDTLMSLEALRRAIATDPSYELIWTAENGTDAVAAAKRDRPDLILMDLLMPGLDGVEATRQIMRRSPCAVLIVTGSVHGNTSKVFEAMGCGALDVVQTPVLGRGSTAESMSAAAQPLLAKMATVTKVIGKFSRAARMKSVQSPAPARSRACDLIVIGASTGGPKALAKILGQFSPDLSAAVVIVQHIDVQFADGLADWLNRQSVLPLALAQEGDRPQPGKVLLAQAHGHLMMKRDRTLTYINSHSPKAKGRPYCPSVDVLFESVAQCWPQPGQAVLLTGMGRDGAVGMSALRQAKWRTIAESQQSCVVYGMPRAAVEIGAALSVLSVDEIARSLSC